MHFRFISTEELVALYRAADVVVYPYRAITTSGALATGLAFLPVNLIMAGLSVGLSAVEALVPRGPAAPPGHAAPPGVGQVQAVPLTVKPDGAVSLLVQVPWRPNEVLPPGLIAAL